MDSHKRDFLAALIRAAAVAPLGFLARAAFGQQGGGMGRAVPPRPDAMPDPMAQPPVFDPKKIQQHNQKVILEDVQKLYRLAGELKDQVEKTDSTSTLSLSMVQKAKEVEKLAKQIANLAVG
jgi:hypothetical protein